MALIGLTERDEQFTTLEMKKKYINSFNKGEDYEKTVKAMEEWKQQKEMKLPMITWIKKNGSLGDWL